MRVGDGPEMKKRSVLTVASGVEVSPGDLPAAAGWSPLEPWTHRDERTRICGECRFGKPSFDVARRESGRSRVNASINTFCAEVSLELVTEIRLK
jgi:hypothetical protein